MAVPVFMLLAMSASSGRTDLPEWALALTGVEQITLCVPNDSPIVPLAEDDPCYKAVAAEMARVKEKLARNLLLDLDGPWPPREIHGRAIAPLFPNHRFFLFVWQQKVRDPLPPNTPRPYGLLLGPRMLLAIHKNGTVETFPDFLAIGSAGDFLAKNHVKIRNHEDARLLWDALCEIYRRDRKGEIEKVSDDLWRVGIEKIDGERRFYDVRLNADFSVQSIKAVFEKNP